MKKLLLIGLVAGVLAFVPAQRSDAGVAVGIGIGVPGYYGYYPYGYYYPYRSYGRIPIMATIGGRHTIGTADIGIITATIVTTIIITDTKVT